MWINHFITWTVKHFYSEWKYLYVYVGPKKNLGPTTPHWENAKIKPQNMSCCILQVIYLTWISKCVSMHDEVMFEKVIFYMHRHQREHWALSQKPFNSGQHVPLKDFIIEVKEMGWWCQDVYFILHFQFYFCSVLLVLLPVFPWLSDLFYRRLNSCI